jgi:hypothetical protein
MPAHTVSIASLLILTSALPVRAQTLDAQLEELRAAVQALRADVAAARRESADLRRELQAVRDGLASPGGDDQELLAAKVDDLAQTRVESGSKYRVRLSGMALTNAAATRGEVDNADLPGVAEAAAPGEPRRSVTAGARQSSVRLDVFGPTIAGARTVGEASFDFFGGFPATREGLTAGLARLRTTSLSLDWSRTSVVFGQTTPFFSPLSPTSLVSSAYPAMWAAGNMWTWTPQVHVDRRFTAAGGSTIVVQGGVLDPLTADPPASEYEHVPTAGERSGVPAPAVRVGWQHGSDSRAASAGAGAYYSRQAWGSERRVDAWAATGDWNVPVASRVSLSGEVYRGRAIAGLGASAAPSAVVIDAGALGGVRPFTSMGGWSEVKIAPTARLELNVAAGTDRSSPAALDQLLRAAVIERAIVRRNTTAFVNGIYLVRSNVPFSVEYRRLQTTALDGVQHRADHVSIGAGIAF